jgi:phosphoribosylglycinamide formyltransferase-1/phosphoribosylamine--glycine ligase/phosphoribosylglycinamide formyltransferase/phosphoribosylformylglycinamidine cyclo-ligase
MTTRKRVAILISGRGSNMAALIAAARERDYPAEIVQVISSRADAPGLDIAAQARVPTHTVPKADHPTPVSYDAAIDAALRDAGVEIVCLAGYMRRLSAEFVARWQGRLINIHPSLLPMLPGLHAHRRALEAGLKIHGCTVHFVTEELDAGPIIAQAAVPVELDDTEERLSQRVLKAEHRLYPIALGMVAEDKVRMEGGRAIFSTFAVKGGPGELIISPEPVSTVSDLESLARFTP